MRQTLSRRITFLLVLLGTGAPASHAQVVPFTNYTTRDGLVSDIVTSVIQDSRGYLWAGTWEGISVFDGFAFRNFTPAEGLPNSFINCITELSTRPGTIVAGMNLDGYCTIAGDSLQHHRVDTSGASNRVFALTEDSRGTLWCGTEAGAYIVRGDSCFPFPSNHEFGAVGGIVESPVGHLYVLSDSGLVHVDLSTSVYSQILIPAKAGGELHLLGKAAGGGVWVGALDSTIHFVAPGTTPTSFHPGIRPEFFLFDDGAGTLWTRNGTSLLHLPTSKIEAHSVVTWTSRNGLDGNYAACAMKDEEGGLWFGGGRGLARLGSMSLLRFPLAASPLDPFVSLTTDHKGKAWILSGQSLIAFEDQQDHGWKQVAYQLAHRDPHVVKYGPDGLVWVGFSDATLHAYDLNSAVAGTVAIEPRKVIPGSVFGRNARLGRFVIDREGLLWVGISGVGVVVCDPGEPLPLRATFSQNDAFPLSSIRTIAEDHEGNIWAGGFGTGLARFSGGMQKGHWTTLKREDGLSDNSIRSLDVDKGTVWIGTRYGGITRIRGNTFARFTVREGLASNAVWGLASDSAGLWIATGLGINFIPSSRQDTILTIDAFPRIPFNTICTAGNGRVIAMTHNDVYVYDPSSVRLSTTPPRAHITAFFVNGQSIEHQSSPAFTHLQNNCVFEFIGLSFDRPKNVRYRYTLEGADAGWHELSDRRSVAYSALQPGSYTFMVNAINAAGVSSQQPSVVRFTIDPPWWETWLFRVLASCAGIAALGTVVQLRFRRLRQERTAQEEFSRQLITFQENERKRMGAELHDSLGQELLLLKNGLDKLSSDIPQASDAIHRLTERASASLKEVREISYDLHPHTLDRLGLCGAIESVASRFTNACGIPVELHLDDVDHILTKNQEINLFRVVQEGLNNIAKHAEAKTVNLGIKREQSRLVLTLKDDGRGFDASTTQHRDRTGFGLTGMGERMRLIGGVFELRSNPGSGTTVQVMIPIPTNNSQQS